MLMHLLNKIKLKKIRKSKEDKPLEKKMLLSEVEELVKKLKSVMKLSQSHKKNFFHMKKSSLKTQNISQLTTQI